MALNGENMQADSNPDPFELASIRLAGTSLEGGVF